MRRVMFGLMALCFLGSVVGCRSMGSSCNTCGSGGANSSSCGSDGCGTWGPRVSRAAFSPKASACGGCLGTPKSDCSSDSCGGCLGTRARSHSFGNCDCFADDYCTSRSPWVRMSHPAPTSEALPAPLPPAKEQVNVKTRQF